MRRVVGKGPRILHQEWIEFQDENGPGFAQPDTLLLGEDRVWIVEAKLTYAEEAWDQLENLYTPLVREIWPRKEPPGLVVACRNLGGWLGRISHQFDTASGEMFPSPRLALPSFLWNYIP